VPAPGGSCDNASYRTNPKPAEYSTILSRIGILVPFSFVILCNNRASSNPNTHEHNVIVHVWVTLRHDQVSHMYSGPGNSFATEKAMSAEKQMNESCSWRRVGPVHVKKTHRFVSYDAEKKSIATFHIHEACMAASTNTVYKRAQV